MLATPRERRGEVSGAARGGAWPVVSIHLPCCAEPAAQVIEAIESLRRLDYPEFEIVVISNNHTDPRKWRPVADFCAHLPAGDRGPAGPLRAPGPNRGI